MVKEFSTISEIKSIREQKSRLSEREQELSTPMLRDTSLIEEIYEWFKETLADGTFQSNPESPIQRKKFIFIILFLYSPSTLAGGKIKDGLRDKIANVTGCSCTLISHNLDDAIFFYQQYKNHRHDIDRIYTEILSRLRSAGHIK